MQTIEESSHRNMQPLVVLLMRNRMWYPFQMPLKSGSSYRLEDGVGGMMGENEDAFEREAEEGAWRLMRAGRTIDNRNRGSK
jgi:hypothetical protein